MKKTILTAVTLGILAGCGATPEPPKGEIVPMKRMKLLISNTPYECYGYSPRNDKCEAIARHTIEGDQVTMAAKIGEVLPGAGAVKMTIVFHFEIQGNRMCGDPADADMSVEGGTIPTHIKRDAIRHAKKKMARDGVICITYLRDADGQYYNAETDLSGKPRDVPERVHFFAERKPLLM